MVYSYETNAISLVQAVVGKTKPTKKQWEIAAQVAKE